MPLYEYDCESCKNTVEVLQRSPSETAECPDCGGEKLTKVFSVPASPAVKGGGGSLPIAAEGCGAPRCCGGGSC